MDQSITLISLHEYLAAHAERVQSGQPADADVIFFGVKKGPNATAEGLRAAMAAHSGEFCNCNPLDGQEHSYLELGGWVGDQGSALILMGLGTALGLWRLLTPKTVLGDDAPADLVQEMAGAGYVSVQA